MASQKSAEILEEMIQPSVDVISLCHKLPLPTSVVNQVTRSVTSIGANFSEAQDASSRKDFINKIYIAKKEASETKYWLAVVAKPTGDSVTVNVLAETVQRFVMLLQKVLILPRKLIANS